jgi:hypothetical protein
MHLLPLLLWLRVFKREGTGTIGEGTRQRGKRFARDSKSVPLKRESVSKALAIVYHLFSVCSLGR